MHLRLISDEGNDLAFCTEHRDIQIYGKELQLGLSSFIQQSKTLLWVHIKPSTFAGMLIYTTIYLRYCPNVTISNFFPVHVKHKDHL